VNPLHVANQDVLTADGIALKISLQGSYQVTDPVKAAHETQNWLGDLHFAAQLAIRTLAGGLTLEALLSQRSALGAQLLARVRSQLVNLGVNVLALEIKDLTLPKDLERTFGEVVKAKYEGQADVARARNESAALRELASGAEVLEKYPALLELQSMQSLARSKGHTLVFKVPRYRAQTESAARRAMCPTRKRWLPS